VTASDRLIVVALVVGAALCGAALVAFASISCPASLPGQACPGASLNRVIVVALGAVAAGLLVAPFAFLAEFVLRRSIAYRGAWGRAGRRGLLIAAVVVSLAALRLGGAFSIPVAIFVVLLAAIVEWFAVRRFDGP
jgi:hypothetical protein